MATAKAVVGRPDRLFVVWAEPKVRRFVVGELWQSGGRYLFAYRLELLEEAMSAGFRLLPEFPERRGLDRPYSSEYLFRTFQQRIPPPTRSDRREILESWGVERFDDSMEALAKSGGVLLTDRLELSEYRSADDDLARPLFFRLAGESHYPAAVADLSVGQALRLQREPHNPMDPLATEVLIASDGRQVGWVPRQYTQLMSARLDAGDPLDARVERRLILPEDRGRWVVRLVRSTRKVGP